MWNRVREVGGDYETIAHIDPCGAFRLYDANMPEYARAEIREHAAAMMERARADFTRLSQSEALHTVMERMNSRQMTAFLGQPKRIQEWTNDALWELYVRVVCESGYVSPKA